MKRRALFLSGAILALVLLTAAVFAAGFSKPAAQGSAVTVAGASDVIRLAESAKAGFDNSSGLRLKAAPSRDPLNDLRSGRADVALLGRELSDAEKQEFDSRTVAYDAVCLLASYRVFTGGIQQGEVGGLKQPFAKFDGLKNLTLAELRNQYEDLLKMRTGDDYWYLPQGYMTFQPYLVGDTMQVEENPDDPGHALGTWVWNFVPLGVEFSTPGLTDTQPFLLDALGLSAQKLGTPGLSFMASYIGSEEEWISSRYDLMPDDPDAVGQQPFTFFLMPVSRATARRALQHGFAIRVLSIEGVDPLADPALIYNGTYPLARKIYALSRISKPGKSDALIRYLLSAQGQSEIKNADFLPLPS